jgi:hypothetical protein
MHHVALDRPGPHDRNLDDQVIELRRAQPRQHVHLRPAFHLEHAHGIPAREHPVHRRILPRHVGQIGDRPAPRAQQRERLADAGEHPQRQHIHLHDAQCVDVVLVPLDEIPVLHRRRPDRHRLDQGPARQHEPAHVLR